VVSNLGHLLARVFTLILPGLPNPPLILGVLVVPLALLGLWDLYARSKVLPLALCFSLGILVVWPFQEIRLLVPFQPFLMLAVLMGFWRLVYFMKLPTGIRIPAAGLALVWIGLFVSVSVFRLGTGWIHDPYEVRAEALLDAARAVEEKTPPAAVVGAPELWAGIHLHTGRTVVPSARFRPLAGEGPVGGTPEQQYEIWISTGVTHILVEHGGAVHGPALDRIDALCAPGTVQVLDTRPGRVLVSLAWDEACKELVLRGDGTPARPR
jgi:hypothetical protein